MRRRTNRKGNMEDGEDEGRRVELKIIKEPTRNQEIEMGRWKRNKIMEVIVTEVSEEATRRMVKLSKRFEEKRM